MEDSMKIIILALLAGFVFSMAAPTLASDDQTQAGAAKVKFWNSNPSTEFSVQSSKDLVIIQRWVEWVDFDAAIYGHGFKLVKAKSIRITSPTLPAGCEMNS